MSDIKSILINMAMLGILVFGLMAFILTVQVDNSVDSSSRITNNSLINSSYSDLESTLEQSQDDSQLSLNASEQIPSTDSIGDLDVSSTISATRTAKTIVIGLWNIYVKLPMVILGVDPVVASIISSILIILIIIGIWAIWKGAIQ